MRRLSACLIVLLLLKFPCYAEEENPAITLQVSISGEFAEAEVVLSGNNGFIAYEIDMSYDSSDLQPLELNGGIAGVPVNNLNGNCEGKSCVKTAYAGAVSVKESGILFTVQFRLQNTLKEVQNTVLHLEKVRFFSEDGKEIKIDVKSKDITVKADGGFVSDEKTSSEQEIISSADEENYVSGHNPPVSSSESYSDDTYIESGTSEKPESTGSQAAASANQETSSASKDDIKVSLPLTNIFICAAAVFLLIPGVAAVVILIKVQRKK